MGDTLGKSADSVNRPQNQQWMTLMYWNSPGRFFSAHELKLMFAYMLLNYDIRHLDERPKNTTLSDFSLAPDIDLFVRRRERSAHLD